MTAGRLRHRIAFQKEEQVSDGGGGWTTEWVTQFTVAARLRPLRGGETVMAGRLEARQPYVITVRQSADTLSIKPQWRAVNARTDEVMAIRSIADMEESGAFLDILTEAGVGT